jgi:acyl-CoA synthetase (NDP forming)
VVLKVVSPDIAHKSEAGGVALNIADRAALQTSWSRMQQSVAAYAPQAAHHRVLGAADAARRLRADRRLLRSTRSSAAC